ncbi:T9SS type A sorting domain-containing protein, partial [bacterium]|nr:T9SS type A sorting domain-containing protein [bacterium]
PNPFNPRTQISFTMPSAGHASVQVLNLRGQLVSTLLDNSVDVGDYTLQWNGLDDNGRSVPSGVYLVRATGAGNINISKVVLAK